MIRSLISVWVMQKKKPKEMARKNVDTLVSYNRFVFKEEGKSQLKLFIKRICRIIFYNLPFKKSIRKAVDKIFEKKFKNE